MSMVIMIVVDEIFAFVTRQLAQSRLFWIVLLAQFTQSKERIHLSWNAGMFRRESWNHEKQIKDLYLVILVKTQPHAVHKKRKNVLAWAFNQKLILNGTNHLIIQDWLKDWRLVILANILWKNGMDLNKNVLTSMNVLGTDSNYLSENEAFLSFYLEAETSVLKRPNFIWRLY